MKAASINFACILNKNSQHVFVSLQTPCTITSVFSTKSSDEIPFFVVTKNALDYYHIILENHRLLSTLVCGWKNGISFSRSL